MNRRLAMPVLLLGLAACAAAVTRAQMTPDAAEEKNFVRETGFTYGKWRSSVIGGGGYIQNVVPCPSNAKRFYAYVDVGGLYRSDDGGTNWRMLHGNLPPAEGNTQVRGLIVDPRDDRRIVIATGTGWVREGIFISDDAGETWKKTLDASFLGNGPNRSAGFVLARHPSRPDVLVTASAGDGVFRSEDGGRTWQPSGAKGLYPADIRFDRARPDRLWLCASGGKPRSTAFAPGFYRSEDGGAIWTKLSDVSPSEILQDPVDAGTLYGIFGGSLIRRSRDAGATWEDFSDGLAIDPEKAAKESSTSNYRYNALAAGPDFILTASTRNSTFYRLNAGETTWRKIDRQKVTIGDWYGRKMGSWAFGGALGSITVDPNDPAHWFLTDWFAIYQTRDSGRTWTLTVNGIEVTVLHTMAQDPSDPAVIQMGMADNGPFVSTDGGRRFRPGTVASKPDAPSGGSNMKSIDVCRKLPSRLYAVGSRSHRDGWASNQVFVSQDRGATWQYSPMTGLPDMANARCSTIVSDPNNPSTVYITVSGPISPTGGGVYRSEDGGQHWQWAGDGLPAGKSFYPESIWGHGKQLAVSADGSRITMSQNGGQVYRFDPAAGKWTDTALAHGGKLWSIAADPFVPGRFFVGARHDGLYRTDDGGRTWKRIYDSGVGPVAVDAAVAGRIAGGTSDGIILSTDGGDTWRVMDRGLPDRVNSIPCFAGERLLAGTSGSGVFWMPLSPAGEKDPVAKR